MKYSKLFLILFFSLFGKFTVAHPIGNIITLDDHVLWSYVSPVGDIDHHACVMIWNQESKPKIWLQSEHTSSDFTLYTKDKIIYIIESRYNQAQDVFETRILKAKLNEKPLVIWPWFLDKWKIGSNGFFMNSDTQVVFGSYPNIYCMDKDSDGEAKVYFKINDAINKIKPVEEDEILLLSDQNCWLTNQEGQILKSWKGLPEKNISNAPMGRNNMYDVDYHKGKLLMAYWGKQSFELIDKDGSRKVLKQCKSKWVPHWVSFHEDKALLFASFMDFETPFTSDGKKTTIAPQFELYQKGSISKIWNE